MCRGHRFRPRAFFRFDWTFPVKSSERVGPCWETELTNDEGREIEYQLIFMYT